jgi:hypothetical protein
MWRVKYFLFGLLPVLFIGYISCVHYTDVHQVAITWNIFTGEKTLDQESGINFSPPWVFVSRIDTRPQRVCVSSSTKNFNCLLVKFEPSGWEEFVELEGFGYYWWSNRISINMGYDEEYRGMKDLLRGYAFDNNKRRFISVKKEIL